MFRKLERVKRIGFRARRRVGYLWTEWNGWRKLDATLARESARGGWENGERQGRNGLDFTDFRILRFLGIAVACTQLGASGDMCGYNVDYVCPAKTSLSPKVLSGCC